MFHSCYPAACQRLLWRWYKYFLILMTTTNSLLLSAGMLDPPLFPFYANPDGVLTSPHNHWGSVKGTSRLSGELPGFETHSEADRDGMSLGIEPGMADLSLATSLPCCLPLPAGFERRLGRMFCDHSNHHPAIMFLPFNKEKTFVLTNETKARTTWVVAHSVDQNGNIIYQWYDEDGHLHTISEWEYKRRLSMYFQSWLEFLYPEFFGTCLPAGGGWHQWQYWKVRRTADRPENTGQQWRPARRRQPQHNGKTAGSVAVDQSVQQTKPTRYQARDQNGRPQPSASGRAAGRAVENEIDTLLMEFKSGYLQNIAARFNKNYDGRKHGKYCSQIKTATKTRKKPLTDHEKLKCVAFMRHLSEVVYSFNGISLCTCIHSLVASQLLYPPRSSQWQRTALDGEVESIKEAQKTLIEALIMAVDVRAKRQERPPYGFDAQAISNLLWALAKLVENGLIQRDQDSLVSQAVTALLPQVVTPPGPFISQHISNLLWALAKLVDNGRLCLDRDSLASEAVTALLRQLQSHQSDFTSQGISNLLWALAKLVDNERLQLDQDSPASQAVTALLRQLQSHQDLTSQAVSNLLWALVKLMDNGRLQLDQDSPASQAVTALLPQVVTPSGPFKAQEISNLLWALAKLVNNGRLQRDQGGLASQAVTALLPQVVTPPGPFKAQEISILLWALAKLVENELLKLDQSGLASQAVTALLAQVVTPPGPFISQHISNLLWALAKLVDNGRLHLDQGDLVSQAVTALLPQVVTPPGPFISQDISNLLWALAKLVENGRLQWDQESLASQALTALLPQLQNHQSDFTSQGISNLLWALAKLVDYGRLQQDQGDLASKAVTALLPQVQSHQSDFTSQGVSNLLWALAKLVENGLLHLDQGGLTSQAVTALLPHVVTSPEPLKPQEISNMLWALAALGDGVRLDEALHILRSMNISTIELSIHWEMTLWALTVFLARSGEESLLLPPMKRLYDALMVEKGNSSDTKASIMWVSGVWLKENLLDLPQPYYETTVSPPHRNLHAELKRNLPRHRLEMEVSIHGLPPVDLLFPDEKVAVEVQGAHHYVDKEKILRNGSTILKTNTYRKLGYKVLEIPVSDVDNTKKQELWMRELQTYFLNLELRDNSDASDQETAEKAGSFSAAEKI